jgi:hypothetical protein
MSRPTAIKRARMKNQTLIAVNVRLDSEIKTALERAAEDERRPLRGQIETVLGEWLAQRGYLKKAKTAATA